MEELWEVYDHANNQSISLTKLKLGGVLYAVEIQDETTRSANSITLDRKHLKDLFNVLGNELGAF